MNLKWRWNWWTFKAVTQGFRLFPTGWIWLGIKGVISHWYWKRRGMCSSTADYDLLGWRHGYKEMLRYRALREDQ